MSQDQETIESLYNSKFNNYSDYLNITSNITDNTVVTTLLLNRYAIIKNSDNLEYNINILNDQISNLDISISQIYELVTNISGIDNLTSISELSSNYYTFKNLFDNLFDLCDNLITFKQDISLSSNIYNFNDISLSSINNFDNSNNFILNYNQTNELINSYVQNLSNTNNEYVNDISQTFYQIITQQPYQFNFNENYNNTSSTIDVSWNYDNIIAKHNIENNAKLSFLINQKQRQLPYINQLIFEISGNVDGVSSGWTNYHTININNDESYNQDSYKNFTINKYTDELLNSSIDFSKNYITSSLDPFDLRIYGVNYATDFPSVDERSIYFNNISFLQAQPPSIPNLINEIVLSNNIIKLTYDVSFTENDNIDSDALLNAYIIDYSQNETLASIIYPVLSNDLSDQNILTNISKNTEFDINLTNLRSGTNYNYKLAVKNNLNETYSSYSNDSISNYTQLPNSSGISTSLNLNIASSSYTNVTNVSLNNLPILYINIGGGGKSITPNISNSQIIEISNPSATNVDTYGFGKFIDNSNNLVSLNVYKDDVSMQQITFDGSFSATSGLMQYFNSNSITQFDYISLANVNISDSLADIYSTTNNLGFRLKGGLILNTIANNAISNAIGDPSSVPYQLKYQYERHQHVNNSANQSITHNVYVDDLSTNPLINGTNSSIVTDVVYNFGIPSVKYFDLSFQRIYSNINSTYNYIVGDKVIAKIGSINNTSSNLIKNINISQIDILSSGIYEFNNSNIQSKTSNYYDNLYYNTSNITVDNNLSWNEQAFNLYQPNGITQGFTHNTNHYIDYNSFNTSNYITLSKIDLSVMYIYEISNILLLGSNLGNLEFTRYTNHSNQIKDYTLMYINGLFQSNTTQTYPNINDYSYNGVTITNTYNNGTNSYDLSGIITSDDSGYKFIVFELTKNGNNAYNFNGINYNISQNSDGTKYLNLTTIFSSIFNNNIINDLFDNTNSNTIGFIKVTRSDDNIMIGNLKEDFIPTGGNWIVNGSPSNISYNNILGQLKYSAKVTDNNNYGIYIDSTAIKDDLKIIIGLKN